MRGLADRDAALHFAGQIDRAFAERAKIDDGGSAAEGYYEEFDALEPFKIADGARLWVREGGGLLAPDAPMLTFEMFEMFRRGRAAEAGRRLPRRAPADLAAEDDAAQGRAAGPRRLAPGRRVYG